MAQNYRCRIEDIMGHGRLSDYALWELLGPSTPLTRLDVDLLRSSSDGQERLGYAFERILRDWLNVETGRPGL